MRAIILAAGRGSRLRQTEAEPLPKCLLQFSGVTLLERHLRLLREAGVASVVLALGFGQERIAAELDRLDWRPRPELVFNERFDLGSMLTLHLAAGPLTRGGDVLLMDADVLYDQRIASALVAGATTANRLLFDRAFEPGPEPVKICLHDGVPVELNKQIDSGIVYETIGESVGFFRFSEAAARRLAELAAAYVAADGAGLPHEEAIRALLKERGRLFESVDVTGAPWMEIDFPADLMRAADDIVPRLLPLPGV